MFATQQGVSWRLCSLFIELWQVWKYMEVLLQRKNSLTFFVEQMGQFFVVRTNDDLPPICHQLRVELIKVHWIAKNLNETPPPNEPSLETFTTQFFPYLLWFPFWWSYKKHWRNLQKFCHVQVIYLQMHTRAQIFIWEQDTTLIYRITTLMNT